MAGGIRPEHSDGVDAAGPSDDGDSNLVAVLAAAVRQSAGQMPQDTPMALVYRLGLPDETVTQ